MDILNVQPPTIEWRVYRNDTTTLTVVLTDSNGAALDLTDWNFQSKVREFPASPDVITTMSIVKNDNALTLALDTADLTNISYFDIQGTNSVTNKISTVLRGQIFVEEDITR
jgi:hypothetical protein